MEGIDMTNRVEKTNEMKIFCSEDEINYNQSNNYAFLNWCFDDAMGEMIKVIRFKL